MIMRKPEIERRKEAKAQLACSLDIALQNKVPGTGDIDPDNFTGKFVNRGMAVGMG